jgi:hypothetical protein
VAQAEQPTGAVAQGEQPTDTKTLIKASDTDDHTIIHDTRGEATERITLKGTQSGGSAVSEDLVRVPSASGTSRSAPLPVALTLSRRSASENNTLQSGNRSRRSVEGKPSCLVLCCYFCQFVSRFKFELRICCVAITQFQN